MREWQIQGMQVSGYLSNTPLPCSDKACRRCWRLGNRYRKGVINVYCNKMVASNSNNGDSAVPGIPTISAPASSGGRRTLCSLWEMDMNNWYQVVDIHALMTDSCSGILCVFLSSSNV